MATHKIVVIVDVEAVDYETATELAAEFLDTADYDAEGILDASVELNFEEDNAGQRVLYLPSADGGGADEEDEDVDPDSVSIEDLAE